MKVSTGSFAYFCTVRVCVCAHVCKRVTGVELAGSKCCVRGGVCRTKRCLLLARHWLVCVTRAPVLVPWVKWLRFVSFRFVSLLLDTLRYRSAVLGAAPLRSLAVHPVHDRIAVGADDGVVKFFGFEPAATTSGSMSHRSRRQRRRDHIIDSDSGSGSDSDSGRGSGRGRESTKGNVLRCRLLFTLGLWKHLRPPHMHTHAHTHMGAGSGVADRPRPPSDVDVVNALPLWARGASHRSPRLGYAARGSSDAPRGGGVCGADDAETALEVLSLEFVRHDTSRTGGASGGGGGAAVGASDDDEGEDWAAEFNPASAKAHPPRWRSVQFGAWCLLDACMLHACVMCGVVVLVHSHPRHHPCSALQGADGTPGNCSCCLTWWCAASCVVRDVWFAALDCLLTHRKSRCLCLVSTAERLFCIDAASYDVVATSHLPSVHGFEAIARCVVSCRWASFSLHVPL